MIKLNNLYIKEVTEYKNQFDKNKKYPLNEIDNFHDIFMNKYNLTWNDIENLIKYNSCDDSIELFTC